MTGLHLATLGTDVVLHGTYFIVAHFHYVMVGGMVMASTQSSPSALRSDTTPVHEVPKAPPSVPTNPGGPSLPKPMELLGAAVDGSQIHALIESTHEIYDSQTGRWRPGPPPFASASRHKPGWPRPGGQR